MGTMLQAAAPTLEDFQGHDGCNETLNVTRPDIVSEEFQLHPEQATDAIVVHHPEARYFNT